MQVDEVMCRVRNSIVPKRVTGYLGSYWSPARYRRFKVQQASFWYTVPTKPPLLLPKAHSTRQNFHVPLSGTYSSARIIECTLQMLWKAHRLKLSEELHAHPAHLVETIASSAIRRLHPGSRQDQLYGSGDYKVYGNYKRRQEAMMCRYPDEPLGLFHRQGHGVVWTTGIKLRV